jgi:hypothetical protein
MLGKEIEVRFSRLRSVALVAGAALLVLVVYELNLPAWVIIISTSLIGAAIAVLGALLLFNRVEIDDLQDGPALTLVNHSWFWVLVWAVTACAGNVIQYRMAQETELSEGRWTRLQPETDTLVGKNGAINWLCFPRLNSAASFAALLGNESNGRRHIAPADATTSAERRYRPGAMVLETDFQTSEGAARIVDFMPPSDGCRDVKRLVEGLGGNLPQAFSHIGLLSSISALNEVQ